MVDDKNLLRRLVEYIGPDAFQLFKFIDWYGMTVFNRLQMEAVLSDLQKLREIKVTPEQSEVLQNLQDICEQCALNVHLYVTFVGD